MRFNTLEKAFPVLLVHPSVCPSRWLADQNSFLMQRYWSGTHSLTHWVSNSVTGSAWELQDKNSGRCSESSCTLHSTSLTTSLWTGCLVLISLCSLCALLLCVQDLQVFQLRHHRWHHSRRMADRIQCFPQGSLSIIIAIFSELLDLYCSDKICFHKIQQLHCCITVVYSALYIRTLSDSLALRCFWKQMVLANQSCIKRIT